MKTLIVCVSVHHGNTEKIAIAMANALQATLLKPGEVNVERIAECDLVGFGSGIYFRKHHRTLLALVDRLATTSGRKAFVFSTSGQGSSKYNQPLISRLIEKGFDVISSFSCKGFDTWGPIGLLGGMSKGRPNEEDLKQAENFARTLKEK